MPSYFGTRAKVFSRLAAPVVLAAGLGACSSIPDWVDPTTWFGTDSQATADQTGNTASDTTPASAGDQTPDLASIPPKPVPPSTPDEQKQVTNALVADRAQAQYSAEALQGGTEPVASPPPAEPPSAPGAATTPGSPQAAASGDMPSPAASTATPSAMPDADSANRGSAAAVPATADTATPTAGSGTQAGSAAASPEPSATSMASMDSPGSAMPAAAPMAATVSAPAVPDSQAGFAPSHAPALDASVARYVSQPILSRYQQTAAEAATPGIQGLPAAPAPSRRHQRKARGVHTPMAAMPDAATTPAAQ